MKDLYVFETPISSGKPIEKFAKNVFYSIDKRVQLDALDNEKRIELFCNELKRSYPNMLLRSVCDPIDDDERYIIFHCSDGHISARVFDSLPDADDAIASYCRSANMSYDISCEYPSAVRAKLFRRYDKHEEFLYALSEFDLFMQGEPQPMDFVLVECNGNGFQIRNFETMEKAMKRMEGEYCGSVSHIEDHSRCFISETEAYSDRYDIGWWTAWHVFAHDRLIATT